MRPVIGLGVATAILAAGVLILLPPEPGASATASVIPSRPTLQFGSRGAAVRSLQRQLIALGYLPMRRVDGVYGTRTWHAVLAFQGWQRLHRDGKVASGTWTALASAHRPRPWIELEHGLELDLQRQVMLVVHRGRTQRAVHISSAAVGYATPRGRFRVYRRERMSWSSPYSVWMPYALYFSGGYAIHGFDQVPAYPASHGCVRMPLVDAPSVYAATALGTPVLIR